MAWTRPTVKSTYRLLLQPHPDSVAVHDGVALGDITIDVPVTLEAVTGRNQVSVTVDERGLNSEIAAALRKVADTITTYAADPPKEIR